MSHIIQAKSYYGAIDSKNLLIQGEAIETQYQTYLVDESRLVGSADAIVFPKGEAELSAILASCYASEVQVTLSGARTGITGGAVPNGGTLISLEKMNQILGLRRDEALGEWLVRCQPGVVLEDLQAAVIHGDFGAMEHWDDASRKALENFREAGAFIYPPDPTETTATIGGTVACNASGARSFHYGPTRCYVHSLRAVLADGSIVALSRGQTCTASNGSFVLEGPDGRKRQGRIPSYTMPSVKNAAGYFAKPHMDLMDLFIGSEGTLAVISEVELRLVSAPGEILGVMAFFPSEPDALGFVRACRGETVEEGEAPLSVRPLALEYFDSNSLNLLRRHKAEAGPSSEIPELSTDAHYAVYVEWPTTEDDFEETAIQVIELLERYGSSEDTAWTATDDREVERLKTFRHTLPEAVNQLIGQRQAQWPKLTKLGTDMAVPDSALETMLQTYHSKLNDAELEYVIFGHIGNNHLHANILPRDMTEYEQGKALYLEFAQRAVELGGTVSAEHGIGKLKRDLLLVLYGEEGVEEMRAVKKVFDPQEILNRGNVFVPSS